MNSVNLTGRLTKDPELRKTTSGVSVCSFNLAVNRDYKKDGQPDADFVPCQAWNNTADVICKYLHKGSLIGLKGRIQTRNYDDAQGKRHYVTEVVAEHIEFLESKNKSQENQNRYQEEYQSNDSLHIENDDLPF